VSARGVRSELSLVLSLPARLLQHLAMLVLAHLLAALLHDGTHCASPRTQDSRRTRMERKRERAEHAAGVDAATDQAGV